MCACSRGGRAGWFGLPALCELFVRRESQRGEEGEPGVRLSCWLVLLLLVTLFDEIRRDQLSDHVSCSVFLSLCCPAALSRKHRSGTETGVGLKVRSDLLIVHCKRRDCATLETLNGVRAQVSQGGGEEEGIVLR